MPKPVCANWCGYNNNEKKTCGIGGGVSLGYLKISQAGLDWIAPFVLFKMPQACDWWLESHIYL